MRTRSAARLLASAAQALRRPFLRRRVGRVVLERIDGVPLLVLADVFNPEVFRTGALLARTVAELELPRPARGEPRVLDMGTGSGVGAVFAARRGWRVVAVDVNPEAVRCARLNALLNHLEDRIDVRQGDLFTPAALDADERFDLVLFNPPFFDGAPRSLLDAAWRGDGVLERFLEGLPAHLAPGGRALVLLSDHGGCEAVLAAAPAARLAVAVETRRDWGNEVATVYSVAPREGSAGLPSGRRDEPARRPKRIAVEA